MAGVPCKLDASIRRSCVINGRRSTTLKPRALWCSRSIVVQHPAGRARSKLAPRQERTAARDDHSDRSVPRCVPEACIRVCPARSRPSSWWQSIGGRYGRRRRLSRRPAPHESPRRRAPRRAPASSRASSPGSERRDHEQDEDPRHLRQHPRPGEPREQVQKTERPRPRRTVIDRRVPPPMVPIRRSQVVTTRTSHPAASRPCGPAAGGRRSGPGGCEGGSGQASMRSRRFRRSRSSPVGPCIRCPGDPSQFDGFDAKGPPDGRPFPRRPTRRLRRVGAVATALRQRPPEAGPSPAAAPAVPRERPLR